MSEKLNLAYFTFLLPITSKQVTQAKLKYVFMLIVLFVLYLAGPLANAG